MHTLTGFNYRFLINNILSFGNLTLLDFSARWLY